MSSNRSLGGERVRKRRRANRSGKQSCGGLSKPKEESDGFPDSESDENATARRRLSQAALFCLLFMLAEVVGGYLANSLSIMTDAAHLLSDLASFLISIFALWVAQRPPTSKLSFGFHRAEILGALVSVVLIWLLTGILILEAGRRIYEPQEVNGKLMFVVAAIGLCVNIAMGFILFQNDVAHSHGLGGHGHSHGDHGRSHVGHDSGHGHSEDIPLTSIEGHELSYGSGHSYLSDEETHERHGHSHGSGHSHESDEESHEGHGHSHGGHESDDGHGHSHGGHESHDGHGHSHGEHGHSHGNGHSHESDEESHAHGHDHSSEESKAGGHSHSHGAGLLHTKEHKPKGYGSMAGTATGQCGITTEEDDEADEESDAPGDTAPALKSNHNINVHAAFLHVLGDAVQSVGVMIAAALIWYRPEWRIADPLCTFLFSIMVLMTTFQLVEQGIHVLMEGSPEGIDSSDVHKSLEKIPGVMAVHDLHIWSLTVGKASLSVHLNVDDKRRETSVLQASTTMLAKRYNIHHTTIQVETVRDYLACNPNFGLSMSPQETAAANAEEDWAQIGIRL
eukprot:g67138.t1